MLADLCDHLAGADVDAITAALGADTRIGAKYLRGAVAYGGPCFPRDNKAFAALARSLGVPCQIAEATDQINDHQVQRLLGAIGAVAAPGARVAILGLSYKLHTSVIEKSQGMALARLLLDDGYRVTLADPLAAAAAYSLIGPPADATDSFFDAVAKADVAVVTTPWPEIAAIPLEAFARPGGRLPVIDPWGVLRGTSTASAAHVILLGRGGAMQRQQALAHSGGAR
jgi:UDPglucose 6-dehydrogenase